MSAKDSLEFWIKKESTLLDAVIKFHSKIINLVPADNSTISCIYQDADIDTWPCAGFDTNVTAHQFISSLEIIPSKDFVFRIDSKGGPCGYFIKRDVLHDKITTFIRNNQPRGLLINWALKVSNLYEEVRIHDRPVLEERLNSDLDLQKDLVSNLVQSAAESNGMLKHSLNEGITTLVNRTVETSRILDEKLSLQRELVDKERSEALQKIAEEKGVFEEERKTFNDKKNTLVRRDILSRMLTDLQTNQDFQLSPNTQKMRWPISISCMIVFIIGFAGTICFGYKVWNDTSFNLQHSIPLTASIGIMISTFVFYIRWQNIWLRQHADTEIRNQNLKMDMQRANWFAEFLFEFRDETGKLVAMPDTIIQVMTKNLFESRSGAEHCAHPADDLASFAKKLTKIKVQDNGIEFVSKNTK